MLQAIGIAILVVATHVSPREIMRTPIVSGVPFQIEKSGASKGKPGTSEGREGRISFGSGEWQRSEEHYHETDAGGLSVIVGGVCGGEQCFCAENCAARLLPQSDNGVRSGGARSDSCR